MLGTIWAIIRGIWQTQFQGICVAKSYGEINFLAYGWLVLYIVSDKCLCIVNYNDIFIRICKKLNVVCCVLLLKILLETENT